MTKAIRTTTKTTAAPPMTVSAGQTLGRAKTRPSDRDPHFRVSSLLATTVPTANASSALCLTKNIATFTTSSPVAKGRSKKVRQFSEHARTALFTLATAVMGWSGSATIHIGPNAAAKSATVSWPPFIWILFLAANAQNERVIKQADPCLSKSSVVADVQYCDRYWECGPDNTKELYDCPNGLVWVGKNRGIADGCDYPWRNPSICANKDLASK